jgi:hypothetical protein
MATGFDQASATLKGAFVGAVDDVKQIKLPTFTNLANTSIINGGLLIETNMPKWPRWYAGSYNTPGAQSSPGLARGALVNTGVSVTNNNLTHICDFRFIFSSGISLGGLVNPVKAFQQAIKQGKNAAGNAIRVALTQLNTAFRTAINALLAGMGADPTGVLSLQFSLAKDVVRKVNEITKKIAQVIADIATIYYLIEGLQQIVAWIKSLPDQLKSILQNCLLNFQNSVNETVASFKGATDLTSLQNSLTSQLQLDIVSAQNLQTSANTDTSSSVTTELVNNYSSSTANAETQVDSTSEVVLVKGYIDQSVTYYLDTISLIESSTTSNMMANTSGP